MKQPFSSPPSRPALAATAQDLSDSEFAELDGLLAQVPDPLDPLDVVMLDGFLCGVIVQPSLIDAENWLPYVFDAGAHRWGEATPAAEQLRARELVLRRHAALNRSLAEFGSFEPFILEAETEGTAGTEAQPEAEGRARPGAGAEARAGAEAEAGAGAEASPTATAGAPPVPPNLDPITAAIQPWVAGFASATDVFAGLVELDDGNVAINLAHLGRYLPAETDAERELAAALDRDGPIASLDDAIAEIVGAVANLYTLTEPLRYKVAAIRRDEPKVGRNTLCPCGSGRKFKQCHGARALT